VNRQPRRAPRWGGCRLRDPLLLLRMFHVGVEESRLSHGRHAPIGETSSSTAGRATSASSSSATIEAVFARSPDPPGPIPAGVPELADDAWVAA